MCVVLSVLFLWVFRHAGVVCLCRVYTCRDPVAVLKAEFCMTCSLLMLVHDVRGDHMDEAYSRDGLITALYVAMIVS